MEATDDLARALADAPPPSPSVRPPAAQPAGMAGRYLDRELSWLWFDRRVLTLATDHRVPLLERLRFLAIFHRNLDEFFMVRVAGLERRRRAGAPPRRPGEPDPAAQLAAIAARVPPMLQAASDCLRGQLLPMLADHDVGLVDLDDLDADDLARLDTTFADEVFPVLTPLAVDPSHPFPYISSLSLSLAVTVATPDGAERFARVKVPEVIPRFLPVGDADWHVPVERLIERHLDRLFPGLEVREAHPFRVTRDADLDLDEDEADDLLAAVEQELRRRRFGAVVRLEVAAGMPARTVGLLADELGVDEGSTFRVDEPLRMADLARIADLDRPELRWPPWSGAPHPRLGDPSGAQRPAEVFEEVARGDLLAHHPYESFAGTVERFVSAAADDPRVLAIKQTLYRTSGDSPIVHALIRAAERGKQVVALVELKARFDEEANIVWARRLEHAGVHVVYGLVGLKTHAKTTLVVRRERDGLRRYVHIGTGNYNPSTAELYTDLSLLSADDRLGADLTDLFNHLTGSSHRVEHRELLVAPQGLREALRELIAGQVDVQRDGGEGLIRAQLNGLVDETIIEDLYDASQQGVQIDLVVRGVCRLRPGVPGLSDRIRVVSVVGRLLEHARILQFGHDRVLIGSADWMPRNLDRRVEVVAPVHDEALRRRLRATLDLMLADNTSSWILGPDGGWTRRVPGDDEEPVSCQDELSRRAAAAG